MRRHCLLFSKLCETYESVEAWKPLHRRWTNKNDWQVLLGFKGMSLVSPYINSRRRRYNCPINCELLSIWNEITTESTDALWKLERKNEKTCIEENEVAHYGRERFNFINYYIIQGVSVSDVQSCIKKWLRMIICKRIIETVCFTTSVFVQRIIETVCLGKK